MAGIPALSTQQVAETESVAARHLRASRQSPANDVAVPESHRWGRHERDARIGTLSVAVVISAADGPRAVPRRPDDRAGFGTGRSGSSPLRRRSAGHRARPMPVAQPVWSHHHTISSSTSPILGADRRASVRRVRRHSTRQGLGRSSAAGARGRRWRRIAVRAHVELERLRQHAGVENGPPVGPIG